MSASTRDAGAGWRLFRDSGYELSLDDVNAALKKTGFEPIAERTYGHYRKLHRYGYQRYVPINQLDVETLRDPVWQGPLRSRYRVVSPATKSAELLVVLDSAPVTISGAVDNVSPVEATVVVSAKAGSSLLDEPSVEGTHALLTIGQSEPRSVVLDLVSRRDDGSIAVSVSFLGLESPAELAGRQSLPTVQATITLAADDPGSPIEVLSDLYAFFEALDAARVVCDEVLSGIDVQQGLALPTPRIERLRMDSPLLVIVSAAAPPLYVLLALWGRFEKSRKLRFQADETSGDADIKKEQARALRIQNDRAQLRADIESVSVVRYIDARLREAAGQSLSDLPAETEQHAAQLVERQLLPGLDRLLSAAGDAQFAAGDVPPLEDPDESSAA